MATYKKHAKFNVFITLPILLGAMHHFLHPSRNLTITFSVTFIYSTLFMNPDLDLANRIRLFSLRGFLTLPFRSYSMFFSHRGLSHHIIFGSLTRIGWIVGWGCLFFVIVYKTLPTKESLLSFYQHYQSFLLYGIGGVCFADWGHLLLDLKKGSH